MFLYPMGLTLGRLVTFGLRFSVVYDRNSLLLRVIYELYEYFSFIKILCVPCSTKVFTGEYKHLLGSPKRSLFLIILNLLVSVNFLI